MITNLNKHKFYSKKKKVLYLISLLDLYGENKSSYFPSHTISFIYSLLKYKNMGVEPSNFTQRQKS